MEAEETGVSSHCPINPPPQDDKASFFHTAFYWAKMAPEKVRTELRRGQMSDVYDGCEEWKGWGEAVGGSGGKIVGGTGDGRRGISPSNQGNLNLEVKVI